MEFATRISEISMKLGSTLVKEEANGLLLVRVQRSCTVKTVVAETLLLLSRLSAQAAMLSLLC